MDIDSDDITIFKNSEPRKIVKSIEYYKRFGTLAIFMQVGSMSFHGDMARQGYSNIIERKELRELLIQIDYSENI